MRTRKLDLRTDFPHPETDIMYNCETPNLKNDAPDISQLFSAGSSLFPAIRGCEIDFRNPKYTNGESMYNIPGRLTASNCRFPLIRNQPTRGRVRISTRFISRLRNYSHAIGRFRIFDIIPGVWSGNRRFSTFGVISMPNRLSTTLH